VWFSNCIFIFFRKQKLPLCGKKKGGGIFAASPQGKRKIEIIEIEKKNFYLIFFLFRCSPLAHRVGWLGAGGG
jgi:hypothetical protein